MQSLTAIAPGINAMRQLETSRFEMEEKKRQRDALAQMRQQNLDPEGVAQWFMSNGTPEQMQFAMKMLEAAREEKMFRQAFGGQQAAAGGAIPQVAAPQNAMIPTPTAMPAQPAAPQPAVQMVGGKTREELTGLLAHPQKNVRDAAQQMLQQFPKPGRDFAPTEIERLQDAIAQLPAGDARRGPLEARIKILTTRPEGTRVEVQVPVYNPDTKQVEFATRERISQGGLLPTSAKPELPGLSEQQAATATRRILQRAQEISSAVTRNPSSEAPGVVEAAVENLPFFSRATNLVRGSDRQIVSSAQADVLDALLYLATGAAYNKEQLEQQKQAYIPSFSDSKETRALKRQRLVQMIDNAKVRAGRAWTPELDAALSSLLETPAMKATGAGATPAAPRTPAVVPAQGNRREIAPGVFVTERP